MRTKIMGILNLTPDSFSDGGKYNELDKALFHAEEMQQEGAFILDVGAESTRPGAQPVSEEEEMCRLIPVLEALHKRLELPLSADTFKASVAKEALLAGAAMINDIKGLKGDQGQMAELIARSGASYVLTHYRPEPDYDRFPEELFSDLEASLGFADRAGIKREQIILDPGIGFGKTTQQNLFLLGNLSLFSSFGLPMLLGASKKSVIGQTLGVPVELRHEGTLATTAMAVWAGFSYVRVHDVGENARFIRMLEEMLNQEGREFGSDSDQGA